MKRFDTVRFDSSPTVMAAILLLSLGSRGVLGQDKPDKGPNLTPIPSGPGIEICEPVAPSGNGALADFGAGCGLWLKWSMGFNPGLGQTPNFDAVIRACSEIHVPRPRFTAPESGRLAAILGVTHAAVGEITGNETKCSLTYQLYAVPSQKAVGPAIKLSGTEDEIITKLPSVARTILMGLEVSSSHAPESVGLSSADLKLLGHYDWYDDQAPSPPEQPQIDALSKKAPLAALLALLHKLTVTKNPDDPSERLVLDQSGGNFLMLGVFGDLPTFGTNFGKLVDDKVAAMNAPNNSALAYWRANHPPVGEESITLHQMLVRLAPNLPPSWLNLARQNSKLAEGIRHGRIYSALSEKEIESLNVFYGRWQNAAIKATALDPDYKDAWLELAKADTFCSDMEHAAAAFWKALSLDKSDVMTYYWGLEMFQPKWVIDPNSLAKVARLAASADFPLSSAVLGLAQELHMAGFEAESKEMYTKNFARLRDMIKLHPDLANPHLVLGYYLYLQDHGQYDEALKELEEAVRLAPNSAEAHRFLDALNKDHKR